MEAVKRVGLDTNIFMGIFLEEKDKLDSPCESFIKNIEGLLERRLTALPKVRPPKRK